MLLLFCPCQVYWPSCMVPYDNVSPPLATATKSLEDCFNDCKTDSNCMYWTFNQDDSSCKVSNILNINSYVEKPNFITGEKLCTGTREQRS